MDIHMKNTGVDLVFFPIIGLQAFRPEFSVQLCPRMVLNNPDNMFTCGVFTLVREHTECLWMLSVKVLNKFISPAG